MFFSRLIKCQLLLRKFKVKPTSNGCSIRNLLGDARSCSVRPFGDISRPNRILFFGSDDFSVASLLALIDEKSSNGSSSFIESIEVVVPPGRMTGRGLKQLKQSPVKLLAENAGLIIHEAPPKTLQGWEIPKSRDSVRFDIGVVVSFGYFLPPKIIESFTKGALNAHPSLLPKYRGASPIQYAILNGDKETGVTIQELHHKTFDAGRILRQMTVPIPPLSTCSSLASILAAEASELLVDTLRHFDYYQANAQEQDEKQSTKAPKISRDMAFIKWDQTSSQNLDRLHRAISHQYPLTTIFNGKHVQLHQLSVPAQSEVEKFRSLISLRHHEPGTIIFDQHESNLSSIYIVCKGDAELIECKSVKMEGKKEIPVKDWINGYQIESEKMKFEGMTTDQLSHQFQEDKMTAKEQEFDRKLHELLERKPPGISASKIKDLTRIAMTSPKQYKSIVHSLQKFIQRCAADYKLGALYVLDSISQAAQRQKSMVSEKDGDGISSWSGAEYLERFEKILEEMFANIMQCPDHDKEKVKRVLDIWLSKDDIYDKEMIRKIKDTYFSQRDATKPLENNVSISAPTTGGPMVGVVPTSINPTPTVDQAALTPTALDSSALLATLNNLTQGTLNIPSFLSQNPITSATSQPIAFNNVAANPIPQQMSLPTAPQFTNANMPSLNTVSQPPVSAPMPATNGFLQAPTPSSSNYTNNTNTTNANPSVNDPLDFDYGDMDEDEDHGPKTSAPNGDIINTAEKNPTGAMSVQPVNVNQPTASVTSIGTQEQYQMVNNQFAPPQVSQGITTDSNQSIPPTPPVPPSLVSPGQPQVQSNQSMPPTSVAPFNYPPPTQPWVAPAQAQQQPPPSNVLPLPQGQYQAPPPFPVPPWNGQQTVPQPPWNSNGPSYPVPPAPRPGSFPTQFPGQPGPQPGYPTPPPGLPNHPVQHQGPPGPPPPGHPMQHQGPPGAPPMGHVMQHHQGPPGPQPLVSPGPSPQGPPGQLEQPSMPQSEVSIAYEDQSIGKDYIKVLSRTLYVGSVSEEIPKKLMEEVFAKYGSISTITINYEKNHAFVKMDTRAAASRALNGLRRNAGQKGKQQCIISIVRWGVGFGPKDCFDFVSGESLIPLTRLTETDRKWLLTSKWGGTSGRPVIGGIVVEEPDIVIGEGFSSGSGNKKLGPQFENTRDRRGGYDRDARSPRSSDSRKFSDASWEGSSPRRPNNQKDMKQWSEKSSDTYQGQSQISEDFLLEPQQPYTNQSHPGPNVQDNRLPLQQTQSDFNSTLTSQDQAFQQRQEKSSTQPFSHKREHFSPQKDEHYRENKRSRWDK
ncbi:3335_t:CDS:10 [Acaulospora morrowiae]|uniref:Methionyl-tRNA formyltransferase, mitochondrial n=1 Tax=Acaulospora morrowiae TaxID=94023 RepID=A0A9N8WBE4_9GLOM|nr:3335_t:CDS:10 [Acaulospora morrowiae]